MALQVVGGSNLVESIGPAKGSKAALQIVDNCAREEGFRAIRTQAGPPVNIVVDRRFILAPICKVALLMENLTSAADYVVDGEVLPRPYLRIPEVCGQVVAELAELDGDDLVHGFAPPI
jgi:hypothetical protein